MRETQTIDKVRIYAVAIYVTRDSFLLYQESSIKKKGDEFELEFSSSSRAGALQFSSWNRADNTDNMYVKK